MRVTGTTVRVKGVKRYRSKGRWFCYHRASGIRLKSPFGTPAFFAELARVEEAWAATGGAKARPGSLGAAIASYRRSPAFTELAPRTRADYQLVFDYLADLDPMPLARIDTAFVARLRDKTYKLRKRRFANYVVSVLGSVLRHGAEYGLVAGNPAKGVKKIARPKNMAKANRAWSAAERSTVLDAAPPYLQVPIALGMFTGMREGDVLRLPRNARADDGWLVVKTAKAGTDLAWPVHSRLAEILDGAPAHDAVTMCVNSRGRPWKSASAFRSAFFKLIRRLEGKAAVRDGLTFHGLRHTVGKLLKEDGASDEDIAVALGQKTVAMARHYSEEADKRTRMTAVVKTFDPLKGRGDPRQMKLQLGKNGGES